MDLQKKEAVKSVTELTTDLHIWPDFHGNRSPLPHLTLRGMVGNCWELRGSEVADVTTRVSWNDSYICCHLPPSRLVNILQRTPFYKHT